MNANLAVATAAELQQAFGWTHSERDGFLASLHEPARVAIRLQRGTTRDQLDYRLEPVPWSPAAFWWQESFRPGATLAFAAGRYYIQDAGSLLAVSLLNPQPGEVIADLCAAPGGKATAILDALGNRGWLLAHEAIRGRLGALKLNLARQGNPRFALTSGEVERLRVFASSFDALLLDAPCSGQSLVGKGKQRTSAFDAKTIAFNAARQAKLLRQAALLVRPGGRLVYATCTFSVSENEERIECFLREHRDWSLQPSPAFAPWESRRLPGTYRLWPHRDHVAGTFAACLCRRPGPVAAAHQRGRQSASNLLPEFDSWGVLQSRLTWHTRDAWFAAATELPEAIHALEPLGPEIAHRKGQSWFPSYALAMRERSDWEPRSTWTLSRNDAAAYVQGRELRGAPDGWSIAEWNQWPLGWIKGHGGRGKNHLPKPARLTSPPHARSTPRVG